jgi:hypothetical protein
LAGAFMLTNGRYLAVTVNGVANFSIQGATDQMFVDLLLMVMTYDSEKHMLEGCS